MDQGAGFGTGNPRLGIRQKTPEKLIVDRITREPIHSGDEILNLVIGLFIV
jgi:hypothetical protein